MVKLNTMPRTISTYAIQVRRARSCDLTRVDLTELGRRQAAALATETIAPTECDLIVCSPLRRTIQTALLGFGKAIRSRKIRIILHPALQENGPHPADTGVSVDELRELFEDWPEIDYSLVTPDWNSKEGFYGCEEDEIKARAASARKWLSQRPERSIAVVSHMGMLCSLLGFRPIEGIDNCEMREHHWKANSTPEHLCLSPLPTRVQDVSSLSKTNGITIMSRSSSTSSRGHL